MKNSVRVDVKSDLDLGRASRSRRDVGQLKAANGFVVFGQRAFALQDMQFLDTWLVVRCRAEDLRLARRNGSVALGSASVLTPPRVSMPSESGVNIQQEHVLDFAFEHTGLDARADRHHFIRVNSLVRLFGGTEIWRFPRRAACVSSRPTITSSSASSAVQPASWLKQFFTGGIMRSKKILTKLFHFGPGKFEADVFGAGGIGGYKWQTDVVFSRCWRVRSWPFQPPL